MDNRLSSLNNLLMPSKEEITKKAWWKFWQKSYSYLFFFFGAVKHFLAYQQLTSWQ